MRKLIIVCLLLLAAVAIGLLLQKDAGYVLLRYGHWTLESSLWVAVLCLIFVWAIVTLVWRLGTAILGGPQWLRLWGRRRRQTKVTRGLEQGFIDLLQGRWSAAEKNLVKVAPLIATPFIAFAAAAKAAHRQGAYARRDAYLWQAQQSDKLGTFAIQLQQAEMQMESNDWTGVVTTLDRMQEEHANDVQLLKLWQKFYWHEQDWLSLCQLLPRLRKFSALPLMELDDLQIFAFGSLLEQQKCLDPTTNHETKTAIKIATKINWEIVEQLWQQIPPHLQIKLRHQYIVALMKNKPEEQSIIMIERFLKNHWDPKLVDEYGLLGEEQQLSRQLRQAEAWYVQHPECPALLLCLARLHWRGQLWGKAQHFLKKLLQIKPCADASYLMGRVQEALGNIEAALSYYRERTNKTVGEGI